MHVPYATEIYSARTDVLLISRRTQQNLELFTFDFNETYILNNPCVKYEYLHSKPQKLI